MSASFLIRDATPDDAAAILAIYAPFVTSTITSFEYEVPSVEVMASRISSTLQTHPYLVAEEVPGQGSLPGSGLAAESAILGYAYAIRHKDREGYQWIAECSIYLAPTARGNGLGTALYSRLFDILTEQGFYKVIAGISGSNPVSEGFHGKLGFKWVATWPKIGNKFGSWIDATWYEKELRDPTSNNCPDPPVSYKDWERKVEKGEGSKIK